VVADDRSHLVTGEDHGEASRPFRPDDLVEEGEGAEEGATVQCVSGRLIGPSPGSGPRRFYATATGWATGVPRRRPEPPERLGARWVGTVQGPFDMSLMRSQAHVCPLDGWSCPGFVDGERLRFTVLTQRRLARLGRRNGLCGGIGR
jgi:hypothetical protein